MGFRVSAQSGPPLQRQRHVAKETGYFEAEEERIVALAQAPDSERFRLPPSVLDAAEGEESHNKKVGGEGRGESCRLCECGRWETENARDMPSGSPEFRVLGFGCRGREGWACCRRGRSRRCCGG